MRHDAHVLIVGGGLGGLCLAQGLKKAGRPFKVFERDEAPFARPQGYRLSITPDGLAGLHANLPPHLWAEIERQAVPQSDAIPFLDPDLREIFSKPIPAPEGPLDRWVSIDRVGLRRTLLAGLEAEVVYSKKLVSYEDADGRGQVACRFEDGTKATGDLLVAADGTRSVVRDRLMYGSNLRETEVVSIAGQMPYDEDAARDFDAAPLGGGQAVVMDGEPRGLFIASHRGVSAPNGGEDYVFWALLARRERFPDRLGGMAPADLKLLAQDMTAHWHGRLRRLISRTTTSTMQAIPYETSIRPAALPAGRVAIMGDAVHNMPPTAGQGANMALKDARTLCEAISGLDGGPGGLTEAVTRYHRDMLEYAFEPVQESMTNMAMMVDREPRAWNAAS